MGNTIQLWVQVSVNGGEVWTENGSSQVFSVQWLL